LDDDVEQVITRLQPGRKLPTPVRAADLLERLEADE
jgi:hypothetical protein